MEDFQRFSGTGTYELLEQAANIAREDDNSVLEAQCYLASGSIKLARSLIDKARADFELAKEMYSRQLHYFGVAHCLCQLGDADRYEFNFKQAKNRYREAINNYSLGEQSLDYKNRREAMDSVMLDVDFDKEIKVGRADCIFRLGIIEQDSELRHEKASRLYQRALNVQSQLGNILGEALCRKRLADTAMAARRHDKAQEHYEQARLLCQKVPYYKGLADCSYSLADLVLKQKDTIQAEALYREALDLYVMTSSEHGKANCRCSLADVVSCKCLEEAAGRPIEEIKRVRESYYEIQRTYIALNDGIGQANCLSGISDTERLLGNEQKADELFVQAMTVAQGAFGSSVNLDPAIKLDVPYLRRWRR